MAATLAPGTSSTTLRATDSIGETGRPVSMLTTIRPKSHLPTLWPATASRAAR